MPCTGKFKSSQDIILMQDTDANHKPDAGFPPAKGLEFFRFWRSGGDPALCAGQLINFFVPSGIKPRACINHYEL
jgi:hypothetical protein